MALVQVRRSRQAPSSSTLPSITVVVREEALRTAIRTRSPAEQADADVYRRHQRRAVGTAGPHPGRESFVQPQVGTGWRAQPAANAEVHRDLT